MTLLKNKKLLIVLVVLILAIAIVGIWFFMGGELPFNIGNKQTPVVTETPQVEPIEEKKNMLIIDNGDYSLEMELMGTWKEYLLPMEERNKYQAFMVPDTMSEALPYLYIQIEENESEATKITEEELIFDLKENDKFFELEQILNNSNNNTTKYSILYKTKNGRNEYKNYLTVMFVDGYKISITYSALDLAYASERGYVDDMIKTIKFAKK